MPRMDADLAEKVDLLLEKAVVDALIKNLSLSERERKELFEYPHLAYQPRCDVFNYSNSERINVGTYIKPIAIEVGDKLKAKGYKVVLRGRGKRKGKDTNYNQDLKMRDALFLSVYGFKEA
jgi:hypothetical protein